MPSASPHFFSSPDQLVYNEEFDQLAGGNMSLGIVRDLGYLEHKTGLNHPEHPGRLTAINAMLQADFAGRFTDIKPVPASLEQLELVHTPAHVQMVLSTARRAFTNLTSDTPASAQSCRAAWLAVGGCLAGLQALMEGRHPVCLALVRPPGHHALPGQAGGFCLFNNLAVTARWAIRAHGLRRILIIDWDVHHGNGIQDVFYNEPEVFYLSSHYYQAYPHSGDWEDVGMLRGTGYTLNICLPPDANDADVLTVYREILPQVVESYDPQLIMVAAGYDAHKDDPLGNTRLTDQAFAGLGALVHRLGPQRGVPLLLALEGGYNPEALAASLGQTLKALMEPGYGEEQLNQEGSINGRAMVRKARQVHGIYGVWMGGMM
jgi:acetoin utilization deacetylase AcuC-like enzyme